MAGESPDNSERERSSGETTEDMGSVPPARRQDPRESYAADSPAGAGEFEDCGDSGVTSGPSEEPEEFERSGDVRLRAAVAAWVSGSPHQEATAAEDATPDDSENSASSGESAEEDGEPRGDLPVRPSKAAPAAPATEDTPTTMFGVVRGDEATTDKESATARAERMTTAFFGSPRKTDASAGTADDGGSASRGAESPGEGDESGHPELDGSADTFPDQETVCGAEGPEGDPAAADAREPHNTAVLPAAGQDANGLYTAAGRPFSDVADGARENAGAEVDDGRGAGSFGDGKAPAWRGASVHEAEGARGKRQAGTDGDPAAGHVAHDTERAGFDDGPGESAADADGSSDGTAGDSSGRLEVRERAEAPDGRFTHASAPEEKPEKGGTVASEESSDANGSVSGTSDDGPPKDRATAVFRAVAPDAAAGGTDQSPAASRLPKERVGWPDAASETGEPGAGGVNAGTSKPDSARPAAREGDSRFVPLRSAEEARPPSTLPEAQPAGVGGEQERTKQQPVPDPPPLELLAQLTNTPPPPETPLRTAVRRVKIWTPLVALLALVFVIVQSARPLPEPTLTLTADATHTFDGSKPSLPWPDEGQAYVEVSGLGVLGSSGEQKPVPIGSVAKTMTAYVVLKENPLKEGEDGPTITIDKKAEAGGKRGAGNGNESVLDGVQAGDKISLRQAISALMIPSANNIARLLARWDSGSEAAFVGKMNRAAEDLGMEDTTYTDPSGLQESTVSTAADQVKLGKQVVEMEQLVSITRLPYWENPFTGERMRNWNALVSSSNAIGIKTGTTTAAGGNLLFAGYEDVGGTRQLVVGAVLGQHKPSIIDTVNAVSRKLLIAAGATLTSETIVRKGDVVGYLDDGLGGHTPVVATEDVQAVGYGGVRVELALEPGDGGVPHSAPDGEKVGVLTVGGGPGQVEVPVALQEKLTEPDFEDKLTRIL